MMVHDALGIAGRARRVTQDDGLPFVGWPGLRDDEPGTRIHQPSSVQTQKACLIDLNPRSRNVILDICVIGKLFAEDGPFQDALAHQFQCQFILANCAHAMVYSAGTQTSLRDRKTFAFFTKQITFRYTDVVENHFAMTFRRTMVHDWRVTHDCEARDVDRHDHKTLALVRRRRLPIVRYAEHNQYTRARVHRSRVEPFRPLMT